MKNFLNGLKDKLESYNQEHIEDYARAVDAFDTGLMKTHEVLSFVHDRIDDVLFAAREGILTFSDKVEGYRNSLTSDEDDAPEQNGPLDLLGEKPVELMTLDEKVEYVLDAYMLERSPEQLTALRAAGNDGLTHAINIIKVRRAHGL